MTNRYYDLTTRGQARRLRKMAALALEQYDFRVTLLRLVANEFNGIFRVDVSSGEKYILRVAIPEGGKTKEAFEAETAWLAALSRDTDLSVPAPLKTKKGEHVITVTSEGVPEPRLCMIFTWVPGTDLAKRINPTTARAWGALMAGLHQHAAGFTPPNGFQIMKFDRVFPFPDPVVLFDEPYRDIIDENRRLLFEEVVARTGRVITGLKDSGMPLRVLHGDLHQWNVRVSRGILSPIDFEDLMWGWPVQDIGIMLYYLKRRANYLELKENFAAGYETVLPWPERFPGEIDTFIAFRGLDLLNFTLQSPNPSWRAEAEEFAGRVEKIARSSLG